MKKTAKKVVSCRVDPKKEEELRKLARKTGLAPSDLLRIAVDLLLQLSDYLGDDERIKNDLLTLARIVSAESEEYKNVQEAFFSMTRVILGELNDLKHKFEELREVVLDGEASKNG